MEKLKEDYISIDTRLEYMEAIVNTLGSWAEWIVD
mgnify:FL=1